MRSCSDRLRDSLVASFGEYLSEIDHHNDNAVIESWICRAEAFVENRRSLLESSHSSKDLVKEALQLAITLLSEEKPRKKLAIKASGAQSMSLFANGFTLPPMLDLDELQAEPPLQQVELLRKAHLDDLLQDWDAIEPIIRQGLQDDNYSSAFLDLHAKWMAESKTMTEGGSLVQSSICDNLLQVLEQIDGNSASAQQVLSILWSAWMHWMMQEASITVIPNTAKTIAAAILSWHTDTCKESILRSWTSIDPHALWLQAWVSVSASATTTCVDDKNFLVAVWSLATKHDQRQRTYMLSILRALLVGMRVATFPWRQMVPEARSEEAVIRQVLDQYLNILEASDGAAEHRMALDAVETILSGCRQGHTSVWTDYANRISRTAHST